MATKGHVVLNLKKNSIPINNLKLQWLSDTHWVCRYVSINAICRTYDSLILTLEEISLASDHSKVVEAKVLLYQIRSFPLIITLVAFD